jgi:superfamily II DNA helicase RecQ
MESSFRTPPRPPRIHRTLTNDPMTPLTVSIEALSVLERGVSSNATLPPCLSLEDAIISASTHVWGVSALRPLQLSAVSHILGHNTPNKLLLVARTGVGKTHVTRTAGVILRGITLIIIPLLSLSADQLRKFNCGDEQFGSINVVHLDEIAQASLSKRSEVLHRIAMMQKDTTSTLFLFVSPQFIMNHEDFRNSIISQAHNGIVRMIKIDEVHLHVQHGVSFRRDIRMMKDYFFNPIFRDHRGMGKKPIFFCCTATMSQEYLSLLTSLTTVYFPRTAQIWSGHLEFQQREINMEYSTSHEYSKKGLNLVIEFLKKNPTRCACVFVNSRTLSHKIVKTL